MIAASTPAATPAGVTLRPLDPDADARALHALDAESFDSSPDYVPESFQMFVTEHLRAHDVAPHLSLVAEAAGEIVGFMLARRWEHEGSGYVDLLAVAPGHQRRGIGTALLTQGFAGFAAAGLVQAQLGVASDNPRGLQGLRGGRDGAALSLRRLRASLRFNLIEVLNI